MTQRFHKELPTKFIDNVMKKLSDLMLYCLEFKYFIASNSDLYCEPNNWAPTEK